MVLILLPSLEYWEGFVSKIDQNCRDSLELSVLQKPSRMLWSLMQQTGNFCIATAPGTVYRRSHSLWLDPWRPCGLNMGLPPSAYLNAKSSRKDTTRSLIRCWYSGPGLETTLHPRLQSESTGTHLREHPPT